MANQNKKRHLNDDVYQLCSVEECIRQQLTLTSCWTDFCMERRDVNIIRQASRRNTASYFRNQSVSEKHMHLKQCIVQKLKCKPKHLTKEAEKIDNRAKDKDYMKLASSKEHSLWYMLYVYFNFDVNLVTEGFTADDYFLLFVELYRDDKARFILSALLLLRKFQQNVIWMRPLYTVLMFSFLHHKKQVYSSTVRERLDYVKIDTRCSVDSFLLHFNGGFMDHPNKKALAFVVNCTELALFSLFE